MALCLQKDFDDDGDSNHPPEELLAIISASSTAHRDALASLQQLAVLDTTIECLAAHAAFGGLAQLSNLTELCIEMVGVVRRPGSSVAQQGLQQLPQLKRMELYTNVSEHCLVCAFVPLQLFAHKCAVPGLAKVLPGVVQWLHSSEQW